jgi:hypothetical protein
VVAGSQNERRAKPVCVKELLGLAFARGALTPWRAGFGGRSVGVGFGSDLSEVPVFRDLPAALDTESPLIVLPDPVLC